MQNTDTVKIIGKNVSIKTLAEKIHEAAKEMAASKFLGTYHWDLTSFDNKTWAICLGWQTGYDPSDFDSNDMFASHDEDIGLDAHLCMKLAYQPANSLLQCDYDVDWDMPYDKESGEVDDNEETVYDDTNYEKLISTFIDIYNGYYNEWKERTND